MRPFTPEEQEHDAFIRKTRAFAYAEAYDDAQRQGFYPMQSDPTSPSSWMAEIILISLGHFMVRSDALSLALGLRSRTLYTEALLTDEHWGGIDPEPLFEIAPQYETLQVGHQGPRHGVTQLDLPWRTDDMDFSPHMEAA